MDPALRADFNERLRRLYADMDAAYEKAAAAHGFACTGCEDSCCRTRFHHHTLAEYHCLREGFERLPGPRRGQSCCGPKPCRARSRVRMRPGPPHARCVPSTRGAAAVSTPSGP